MKEDFFFRRPFCAYFFSLQLRAVSMSLAARDYALVEGTPGSGKSRYFVWRGGSGVAVLPGATRRRGSERSASFPLAFPFCSSFCSTIVALVAALAASGKRVLVASYTNAAVDTVLLKARHRAASLSQPLFSSSPAHFSPARAPRSSPVSFPYSS